MRPETKERLDLLRHMYADSESFDLDEVGFLLDTIDELNAGYETVVLLNDKLARRIPRLLSIADNLLHMADHASWCKSMAGGDTCNCELDKLEQKLKKEHWD